MSGHFSEIAILDLVSDNLDGVPDASINIYQGEMIICCADFVLGGHLLCSVTKSTYRHVRTTYYSFGWPPSLRVLVAF